MSYRIAMVRFGNREQTYPVNCHRADISRGDIVIVELPERSPRWKKAEVIEVLFKNWNCRNRILSLASECQFTDGQPAVKEQRARGLIHTEDDLKDHLAASGWCSFKPRQSTWRVGYRLRRDSSTATILFRKNGIDFRIGLSEPLPSDSKECVRRPLSVSHWYHESGVDLYEFCKLFAAEFAAQGDCSGEFFVSKGKRFERPPRDRNDLRDIYEAISDGSGAPAYLSDGVWLTSGGGIWSD